MPHVSQPSMSALSQQLRSLQVFHRKNEPASIDPRLALRPAVAAEPTGIRAAHSRISPVI